MIDQIVQNPPSMNQELEIDFVKIADKLPKHKEVAEADDVSESQAKGKQPDSKGPKGQKIAI